MDRRQRPNRFELRQARHANRRPTAIGSGGREGERSKLIRAQGKRGAWGGLGRYPCRMGARCPQSFPVERCARPQRDRGGGGGGSGKAQAPLIGLTACLVQPRHGGAFYAGANPRGGAGGVACAGFRRFAGTCGTRPPRARRRRNMGSAGAERRDEEETWQLDLSGA